MKFASFGQVIKVSRVWILFLACFVIKPDSCKAVSFVNLHSFDIFLNGETPYSSLVQGSNGDFYGTTFEGGSANAGVIFETTSNGPLNTLYSFTNGVDGAFPDAGLILANDGNFYGTAVQGGTNSSGTLFRITPAGVFSALYSFGPLPKIGTNQDGAYPGASLVQASDNFLYGTATAGGVNGSGTIFRISLTGNFQVLYSFSALDTDNENTDGSDPEAALIQGADGDLYGTTYTGGTNGLGSIFKYNISQNTLSNLHSFLPPPDGANPLAALVATPDGGAFFGTTSQGGTNSWGTTFRLNQNGSYYRLYDFTDAGDGANPMAPLVLGANGILYGTCANSESGFGSVFAMQESGAVDPIDGFGGDNSGGNPTAALFKAADGNLYGTTSAGGLNNAGTIYRIDPSLGFFPVLSFIDGGDGSDPRAPLIQGTNGHFYGTTYSGGASSKGTIFDLTPDGTFKILYSFTNGQDGGFPASGLTFGTDGNLYGTSFTGGAYDSGVAFKLTPQGILTVLHDFKGAGTNSAAEGLGPEGSLTPGINGNFFGTTYQGGNYYAGIYVEPPLPGTVFEMNTNGTVTGLYTFTNGVDGGNPKAGVIIGNDGALYGTTTYGGIPTVLPTGFLTNGHYGTIFRLTTNGVLTHLYTFTNGVDGRIPLCKLIQLADGSFYGTASTGGAGNHGTIFKLDSDGNFTTLYAFTNGVDGGIPDAGLMLGPDGNFYGTASSGGSYGMGTIFEITSAGSFTPLYSFQGGSDGSTPMASLTLGTDGNLYGTTSLGGPSQGGTAFKVELSGVTAPRIVSLVLGSSFNTVIWSAASDQLYQLQTTTNLEPANWINLGIPIMGTNGLDSFEDTDVGGAQRFYRVLTTAP